MQAAGNASQSKVRLLAAKAPDARMRW